MDWHLILAVAVFLGVILVIALDLLPMVVASLIGTAILYLTGTVGPAAHSAARLATDPVVCLLLGGMVVTRSLASTGVFNWLSEKMMHLIHGQGWRLLVGIALLSTVASSVLPNEIVVVLLAPIIIKAAQHFKIDIFPLMLVAVFAANSAGILTLVGDPATYIGGTAMNETFIGYLQRMSFPALLGVLTLFALLPFVFRDIWRIKLEPEDTNDTQAQRHIERPYIFALLLAIMGLMILFFVIGDSLPTPIPPQLSCLAFGTLALTVVHLSRLDSVDEVLNDIDWHTIIFLASMYILVQGLDVTGAIDLLSVTMAHLLGKSAMVANLTVIWVSGIFSGVVPNAPLMATMVPIIKNYLLQSGMVTPHVLDGPASAMPKEVYLLFSSMILAVTLGGNLTLIGAAANIVGSGICSRVGSHVTFGRFVRYGIPVAFCQLAVSALYVLVRLFL